MLSSHQSNVRKLLKDYANQQKINWSDQLDAILDLIDDEIKINLTTFSLNYSDGIGDYVSQLYFIKKLNDLFGDYEGISLKHVSVVTENKIKLAEYLSKEMNEKYPAYVINDINLPAKTIDSNIQSHSHIIIQQNKLPEKEFEKFLKEHEVFKRIFSDCDFLFNLAISFDAVSYYQYITKVMKQDAMINSWIEYGYGSDAPIAHKKIISEKSMGVRKEDMGIRIDDTIEKYSLMSDDEKAKMLSSLDNRFLLSLIHEKIDPNISQDNLSLYADYLKKNSIVVGYIQNEDAAQGFVGLAAHCHDKEDLIAIVNINYFEPQKLSQSLKDHLKSLGFTHIRIDRNNKFETVELGDSGQAGKTLTLVNFNGITAKDKKICLSLANMVAGSGDTSITEMFSSALGDANRTPLPFIQAIVHKLNFYNQIVSEINICVEDERNRNLLSDYIKKLTSYFKSGYKNPNFVEFCEEVKRNNKEIKQGWNEFAKYVAKHRNEHVHFAQLVAHLLSFMLLKNNYVNESLLFSKLFKIPEANLGVLLHEAIFLQNHEAIQTILKSSQKENSIEEIIHFAHSYNGYKPIHTACATGNEDVISILKDIDVNIIDERNNLGETPLFVSWKFGQENTFNYLLDHKCDLSIKNNQGESIISFICNKSVSAEIIKHEMLFLKLLDQCNSLNSNFLTDKDKATILCLAVNENRMELLNYFLMYNLDLNTNLKAKMGVDDFLLFYAFKKNNIEFCLKLIDHSNYDINKQDQKGMSILHLAIQNTNYQIASCLLNKNADVNVVDQKGMRAIDYFIMNIDSIPPPVQANWFQLAKALLPTTPSQSNLHDLKYQLVGECLSFFDKKEFSFGLFNDFFATPKDEKAKDISQIFKLLSKMNPVKPELFLEKLDKYKSEKRIDAGLADKLIRLTNDALLQRESHTFTKNK